MREVEESTVGSREQKWKMRCSLPMLEFRRTLHDMQYQAWKLGEPIPTLAGIADQLRKEIRASKVETFYEVCNDRMHFSFMWREEPSSDIRDKIAKVFPQALEANVS